uniref:Histidine-rich glycoprotein n=1 Tax=Timema shepardi TaxID=629360 RepID=A0A7R9AM97_TIMSH|nr:unnamed protein product [Timema shepardi]
MKMIICSRGSVLAALLVLLLGAVSGLDEPGKEEAVTLGEVVEQVSEGAERDDKHAQEHAPAHGHHHHHLPHLPHHHKETIIATKTLFVEVTKQLTRHPVCVTVYGVKPPCLPYLESHHGPHWRAGVAEDGDDDGLDEPGLYIQPTAALRIPPASAASDLYQMDLEFSTDIDSSRQGKYLEFKAATPAPSLQLEASISSEPSDDSLAEHPRLVQHLLHHKPETKVITKTLWVTKVEKVIDHRVTATLVAQNCVPTDAKIPFCGESHPPVYHGESHYEHHHEDHDHEVHHKPSHHHILDLHHEGHKPHVPAPHHPGHKPVHHGKPEVHHTQHKPEHHVKPEVHHPQHKPIHHGKPEVHHSQHKPEHHGKPEVHHPQHKPDHHGKPDVHHPDHSLLEHLPHIPFPNLKPTEDIHLPAIHLPNIVLPSLLHHHHQQPHKPAEHHKPEIYLPDIHLPQIVLPHHRPATSKPHHGHKPATSHSHKPVHEQWKESDLSQQEDATEGAVEVLEESEDKQ